MGPHVSPAKSGGQQAVAGAKVVDPDECVDEHSAARTRPAPGDRLERSLGAAEGGQASGALAGDQGLEPGVEHGGLFLQAAEALRLRKSASSRLSVVRICCSLHA